MIKDINTDNKILAENILKCINNSIDNQPNIDFSDEIIELIITTQILEPYRTPGTDKLSRSCFQYIADGKLSFEDVFDIIKSSSINKLFISNINKIEKIQNSINSNINYSYDMSDSSDDEF